MYSFPSLEPVCCSMSSSNYCFLTCIQIAQEAGKVVWYSHLFKNFPQFAMTHTVKGFGIVNKTEVDIFLELSCFFDDPTDVGNLTSVLLPFQNPTWTSGSSWFEYCWSLVWRILSNIQKTKIMASSPITSWQIDGEKWEQWQTLFSCAPKSLWKVTAAMKLKDTCSSEEKVWQTWTAY